jgi:hypothetical protein
MAVRKRANDFLLEVVFGLTNPDSVVSGELLQEPNSLPKYTLPVISVGVLQMSTVVHSPLFEQHGSGILALEECRYCLLKTPTETERRPRILLLPTVQIPKAVAPRAT